MSDTNNILAMGDGQACKQNFMQGMKDMQDTILLCKGILILIPLVN